jgi:hypothetical protein
MALAHSTRARHTCSFYTCSFSLHHATCTRMHSLQGRLKLRVVNDLSELIFYDRPDRPGPKPSDFHTTHVSDPDTLRETLRELLLPCFRALVFAHCIYVACSALHPDREFCMVFRRRVRPGCGSSCGLQRAMRPKATPVACVWATQSSRPCGGGRTLHERVGIHAVRS